MTRDIQSFEKNIIIFNIIGEITGYQADLNLSETSREVFPQSSCKKLSFVEFMLIASTNSTVFQPLSFRNLKIFPQPMVTWSQLFACLYKIQNLNPLEER